MLQRSSYLWLVQKALEEDIGSGDVTTQACFEDDATVTAYIKAKEDLIFCGGQVARTVFFEVDPTIRVDIRAPEGEWVLSDDILMTATGSISSLLAAERTMLNFIQRMCGVATLTARYVAAIAGTASRVLDTRKTLPGWRVLDKYAVTVGGGHNHRTGLFDGVLIKDNHIAAVGSISGAVLKARSRAHHLLKIEIEVETLEEALEAANAGADLILLDNMTPDEVTRVVQAMQGRCKLEVSGNVSIERIQEYAQTGVDYISVGKLTHSATGMDISMIIAEGELF